MGEEVSFQNVFETDDPKLTRKRKNLSHYEEEEATVEFASKIEEHYNSFFYQTIEAVVNCICSRYQQKDLIETLQALQVMPLKVLREEDFSN